MPDPTIQQHLHQLLEAGLIQEASPETFVFRHALTREAVYATLLKRQRAAFHGLAAEVLESGPGEAADGEAAAPQAAILAFHYREAGNWPKTLELARRAGDQAQNRYAQREAAEHFTTAIEAAYKLGSAPDLPLLRARGQAYDTLGDFERARADYELGLSLAQAAGNAQAEWQALLDLGFLWAARDYSRTGDYFQQAVQRARASGDALTIAGSLNRLGNWLVNTGQLAAGLAMHQEALHMFREQGSESGMAETHDLLGLVYVFMGDIRAGDEQYAQAIALFRRLGDKRGLAGSLAAHSGLVDYSDVLPWATGAASGPAQEAGEAMALAEQIGWLAGKALLQWLSGFMWLTYGDLGAALDYGAAALRTASEIEHRQWQTAAHFTLGRVYTLLLAPETAAGHLQTAQSSAYALGSVWWISFTSAYRTLAELQMGQVETARQVVQTAAAAVGLGADWPARAPVTLPERLLAWAWGETLLADGRPAEALAVADGLIGAAINPSGHPMAHLLKLRGAALMGLGHWEAAQRSLDQALEGGRAHPRRPVLWQIHMERARLAQRLGRSDQALSEIEAGRRLVAELAQTVEAGPLRDTFVSRALAQLSHTDQA